jgi:uncharacterized protein YhfF
MTFVAVDGNECLVRGDVGTWSVPTVRLASQPRLRELGGRGGSTPVPECEVLTFMGRKATALRSSVRRPCGGEASSPRGEGVRSLMRMSGTPSRACEFALPGPLRDRLVGAVLDGTKTTTWSLLAQWESEKEELPDVGERQTLLDSGARPVAVIELVGVDVIRLGDADVRLALDEGEGFGLCR